MMFLGERKGVCVCVCCGRGPPKQAAGSNLSLLRRDPSKPSGESLPTFGKGQASCDDWAWEKYVLEMLACFLESHQTHVQTFPEQIDN